MKSLAPYAGYLIAAFFALVMLATAGCKTAPTDQQRLTASIAVKYATAKYIEKAGPVAAQAARAARVIAVVDQISGLASGDTTVTVDALVAYVSQRLPVDLSPADRLLAGTLIDAAATELRARIGEGALTNLTLLEVKAVLQWVRDGATPYAGAAPGTGS